MTITCDRCLSGQRERCRRGNCAQWLGRRKWRSKWPKRAAKRKRATGARRGKMGTRVGRPPGGTGGNYAPEIGHQAALMLLDGVPKRQIAEATGITYEQVRTVLRNLHELNGVNVRRRRD